MLIRRELPADAPAIRAIHDAAFDGDPSIESRLVDDLRSAGDVIPQLSLVAESGGEPVGHVVVSRAQLGDDDSLGLGPLGVLPAVQRQGVGSALMHAALAAADALGFPEVVLLGSPTYYSRFGFRLSNEVGIAPPNPHWAAHFQVRTLSAWDDRRGGAFRYAPAFPAV
ncbi:N-acetyltransferase [Flexivirga sp. ID2601S]|uniref:N-acetyltransferase n=1 Tax=Flexivirga aerilata TaxID=1656889 RepID=A0A849AHF0_9MICO|nr:N-acetyltransferase [Flexivirga aerilata]NNG38711.1 N-acetyltransferase [Flexivirga aerilata]